jgi:hypothetical protein
LSTVCPNIHIQNIHSETQNFRKEIVNLCFFGEMAKPYFPAKFNRATPTTVHWTSGTFFQLPFVESVRRQNVKNPFFSGFQPSDTQPPFIGRMVRSFGCCPWEMQGAEKSIFDNFYKNVME